MRIIYVFWWRKGHEQIPCTFLRVKGEQNLYNITTVTSSPGNIWTRQVLDLIGPGAGSEMRVVFEAKILDPSISSHVAVDDVSFKKSCLYVTKNL